MRPSIVLTLLLAVGAAAIPRQKRSIMHFSKIIQCTIPNSNPLDYNDYGCYCGLGGSGTPVDELDRCCQVHDQCYDGTKNIENCKPIFDNPYTEFYKYSCTDNKVTCSSENDACEMYICECDRNAAVCFSKAPYNAKNKYLKYTPYCH
ncbi:phospholipase A2, minor isoenzyme-like [Discoglossus pictus]